MKGLQRKARGRITFSVEESGAVRMSSTWEGGKQQKSCSVTGWRKQMKALLAQLRSYGAAGK